MKNLVVLILFILLCFEINSQWYQQTSGITENLWGVSFINANTGIAAGDNGKILRTTNGGTNWVNIQSGTANWLLSVKFIDSNIVLAAGGNGTILRSSNGGLNWVQVSSGTNLYFRYIHNSGNICYAVGNEGVIIKSTNSGAQWFGSYGCNSSGNKGVFFVNPTTGFVSCWLGWIMKTTNGGANWSCSYTGQSLEGISFSGSTTGTIVGYNGRILRTENAGQVWIFQDIPGRFDWYFGVQMINDITGYICGQNGIILKTTNSGNNWNYQNSGLTGYLYMLSFANANTGTIVGENGKILHTTNGGAIGIKQIGTEIPGEFELSQNYPNPFNPVTKIRFSLPSPSARLRNGQEGGVWNIRLVIYDILGKEVVSLIPPLRGGQVGLKPGKYEVTWDASDFSSGVYYYRLETELYSCSRKMILIK